MSYQMKYRDQTQYTIFVLITTCCVMLFLVVAYTYYYENTAHNLRS